MYLIGAFITTAFPSRRPGRHRLLLGADHRPGHPQSAEEAPTDGYFASAKTQEPGRHQGAAVLPGRARRSSRPTSRRSGSSNLPTSPDVDTTKFSPLVQKGIKLLHETKEITQFFNRDSSDALQTTADTALTRFLDQPDDVATDPQDWQAAAEKVWTSSVSPVTADAQPAGGRNGPSGARSGRARAGAGRSVTGGCPPSSGCFLLVPLAVELVWVFWPAFNSFQLSFTKWNGVGVGRAGRA